MSKISELSDGGVIQGGDTLIAVRSGGNVKVTYGGTTTANIDGGTIDGTVIGGTTPAAGSFTTGSFTGNVSFGDNDKAVFGAGSDLQIYHSGSHSFISEAGTGDLYIGASSNIALMNAAFSENKLLATTDGALKLYYDGSQKLATTSTGIDVTGTVSADSLVVNSGAVDEVARFEGTGSPYVSWYDSGVRQAYIGSLGNTFSIIGDTPDTTVSIATGGVDRVNVTSAGIDVTGSVVSDGLTVDGSAAFNLGAGEEVSIYRSTDFAVLRLGASSTDHWSFQEAGTNSLYIGSIDSGTGSNRLRLDNNGDISFYEDTGTTAKLLWSAANERLELTNLKLYSDNVRNENGILYIGTSGNYATQFYNNDANTVHISGAGNVGIGSTPIAPLHVKGTTNGNLLVRAGSLAVGTLTGTALSSINDAASATVPLTFEGSEFNFVQSNAVKIKVDSSGNLLVGKSSVDVGTAGTCLRGTTSSIFTVSGSVDTQVAIFNRTSNDGTILDFRKDATTVGSIGTAGGDLTVGTGDTGIRFDDGTDQIYPVSGTTTRDAAVSLGWSGGRFKDLYLSGGAYLGGTGSANLLDDYEQGTFTPSLTDGTTSVSLGTQYYEKVGRLVSIYISAYNQDLSSLSTTGNLQITGLPFTVAVSAPCAFASNSPNGKILAVHPGGTSTYIWITNGGAVDFSFGTKATIGLGTGNASLRGQFNYLA